MQTFVPIADVTASIDALDKRRCWKQCVEALALLRGACPNHPASRMWRGFEAALALYYSTCLDVCVVKHRIRTKLSRVEVSEAVVMPPWWGGPIHANHRARLLAKDFAFYSQYGWQEQPEIFNLWPSANTCPAADAATPSSSASEGRPAS